MSYLESRAYFRRTVLHVYDDDYMILEGKNLGSMKEPDFLRDKLLGLGHALSPEQISPNRRNHTTVAKRQMNRLIQQAREETLGLLVQFMAPPRSVTPPPQPDQPPTPRPPVGISWTRFSERMRDILRNLYYQAFVIGMRSTGVHEFLRPNNYPVISLNDTRWLDSAIRQELMYFNRFLDQIRAGGITLPQASARLEHYFGSTRSIYLAGRVAGTPVVFAVYWVLDKDAEHCDGCLYLRDNSPFTKYNLPTQPGAGSTPCLGNCRCRLLLVKMKPELVADFVKNSKTREYHTRNLARIKNKLMTYTPRRPLPTRVPL